jgi:hypothetical protein
MSGIVFDWRDVWYSHACCKLGSMCRAHLKIHRAACGWPGKKCDVCDENERKHDGTPAISPDAKPPGATPEQREKAARVLQARFDAIHWASQCCDHAGTGKRQCRMCDHEIYKETLNAILEVLEGPR